MNIIFTWLLLGSLGLNFLYMYHNGDNHVLASRLRGFFGGLALGPLCFILWLNWLWEDFQGKKIEKIGDDK